MFGCFAITSPRALVLNCNGKQLKPRTFKLSRYLWKRSIRERVKHLVIWEGLRVDLLPLYIERSQLMWFGRVLLARGPGLPGGITLWSRKASVSLGRPRGGQGEGGPGNSAFRGGSLSREVAENGCRGGWILLSSKFLILWMETLRSPQRQKPFCCSYSELSLSPFFH